MIEIDDYVPARRYLAPRTASLWRWDEAAEALFWTEGGTIAFRQELLPVLERMASRGLPPMSSLVWLLGACRENWPEMAARLISRLESLLGVDCRELPAWLPQLLVQLEAVHRLPAEVRTLPAAKAELAAMVFEWSRRETTANEAVRIVRVLAGYREPGLVASQPGRHTHGSDVLAELRRLHEGLLGFDAAAFRLRYQTGLEQPVEAADLDLEPAEQTRQLIARLQDDEELGGVARIARQMLAAIHLPRAISDLEDLPVGGVSDISNRGPLDRLLLSELAHDDLTLAVRLAMNEALYLRRETPPSNPPKHRTVLLDSGLRLWGVPRVFATAVGMALAAGAQPNVRTDIFRATAAGVAAVSLADRGGLVAHLEALEPEVHPGASLAAFAAASSFQEGLLDPVIITSEDTAADPEFQSSLSAVDLPALMLATVSREGRFRLVSRSSRGSKLLREATLDLKKLLAPPIRRRPPLVDPRLAATLPAILSVRPFPLRLSCNGALEPAFFWKPPWEGLLSIARHRLLHWQSQNFGARLLSDNVPLGPVQWSGANTRGDETVSLAIVGALQENSLKLLWVSAPDSRGEAQCETLPIEVGSDRPLAACGHAGSVFVVYRDRIDVFETTRGEKVHTLAYTTGQWRRDRFFAGPDQWYALSHDGFKPVFEPLLPKGKSADAFLTFVDVPGIEGPVGVKRNGNLYHTAEDRKEVVGLGPSPPVLQLRAVSPTGDTVAIYHAGDQHLYQISLANGHVERVPNDVSTWLLGCLRVSQFCQPQVVRSRFARIFVDPQGRLGLVSRRSESVICLSANGQIVLESRQAETPDKRLVATFNDVPPRPGGGFALHAAQWRDGSTAWLDSRGMLHLKSSDPALPEVSLVLRDGALAGWTTEGRTFGLPYFAGEHGLGTEAAARQDVLQLAHVLAGRAPVRQASEAQVYNNILQRFVAQLL